MRERWWAANPRIGQVDPDDPGGGTRPRRTRFRGRTPLRTYGTTVRNWSHGSTGRREPHVSHGSESTGRNAHRRDPRGAAVFSAIDGIVRLLAARNRTHFASPLNELRRFRLVAAGQGSAVFAAEVGDYLSNGLGAVHGGALAILCDEAIGYPVHSTLAMGTGYATLELSRLPRLAFAGSAEIRCAA